ncbi:MAG: 50S ribosomal protein L11 methyltransferase [Deltaproteobacteria bacterium]|nr:50S ribosomal protein L11 methyltransferase [Deltaproteobacteria bacterium]
MHPQHTYELRVNFVGETPAAVKCKERMIDWLLLNGVESFVEGELAVDINQNQDEPPRDYYTELGGDQTPLSVYRYSRESLDDLRIKLEHAFGAQIETALNTMETELWMEGWKESFQPFATEVFYVRPPWITTPAPRPGLIDLVIEPGMAFGTGQHATTRLCLEQVGADFQELGTKVAQRSVLDVGCGTGILLIGAKKLGYGRCLGTDIEDDAILASKTNAQVNGVATDFMLGSLPDGETFDLVLANILAVVIIRLMPQLAAAIAPGGKIVFSGLLTEEADEVIAAGCRVGLAPVRQTDLAGWGCIVMSQPQRR